MRKLIRLRGNEDKYIIPGGGVENDETLSECCEREMLEEKRQIKARNVG